MIGVNAGQAKAKKDYKCPAGFPSQKVKHKFLGGKKASSFFCKAKVASAAECEKFAGAKAHKKFLGKMFVCKVPAVSLAGAVSAIEDGDDGE